MNSTQRHHIAQAGQSATGAGGGRDLDEALLQARRHSRRVRRLKILLPATAVLMVAGFVAYSYVGVPEGVSVDLGGTTLEDGRIVMANPELDGFTRDNRAYSMRAERAMQEIGNSSVIELEKIDARLPFDEANWADIEAERGLLDREANTLRLENGMTVRMDNGITARFRSAKVDIAAGGLESSEPVTIEMEGTNISADSMRVTDRGNVMIFENRVRMEIDAQRLQTAARDREAVDAQSQ
jgi:lipopolysaccharide export system protein LptC